MAAAAAGATVGVLVAAAAQPADVLRTRMQASRSLSAPWA